MTKSQTTVTGTVDLDGIDYGETGVAIIEFTCNADGRRKTATGETFYRTVTVVDAFPVIGTKAGELLGELRRHRRELEAAQVGSPNLEGIEDWLDATAARPGKPVTTDGSGVVVTDADRGKPVVIRDEAAHYDELRARVVAGGKDGDAARQELDAAFATTNDLTPDEEVIEDDDGVRWIVGPNDDEPRLVIELPTAMPPETDRMAELEVEPIDGYDTKTLDELEEYVHGYVGADLDLGGPSQGARDHVDALIVYERGHGARADILRMLDAELGRLIDAEEDDGGTTAAPPWESYPKDTADTIIAHLKNMAETDEAETRRLIDAVAGYETANKARKGVLDRLAGILPPPIPDGPDDDLELDDDENFEPSDKTSQEDPDVI